jgi:hypothetical protein
LFYLSNEEKGLKTIHKILLASRGIGTSVQLPVSAQILRVDVQYGWPYVWVFLDDSLPNNQLCEFLILGTGDLVPDGFSPVGTFFEHAGNAMVWHAFVRMPVVSVAAHVHTGVSNV